MPFEDVNITPSSNLGVVQYDPATGQLAVTFKRGGEIAEGAKPYIYTNVPPSAVEGLANAESAGSHFAKNIRGVYDAVAPEKDES